MKNGVALGVLLASLGASEAAAQTTLWLVKPLYPGQEALVDKTQVALDKLIPEEARKASVIGLAELASAMSGQATETIPCLSGEDRCADPIDPFVASLGFGRVVLIRGGQDESGYTFQVTAYEPGTGKKSPASATNAVLEKALLGAVARVVPVAASLVVTSQPPGATVYVDDVKVGVTPLKTQVLPGERVVRVDLKLHQPEEEIVVVPIRGEATVDKKLEKVAARIIITALPAGTVIAIDGQQLGRDKVDRGIVPGKHTLRLTADDYKAFEQTIEVKADQQYTLDKTLEPIPGKVVVDPTKPPTEVVQRVEVVRIEEKQQPPPPPPPAPPAPPAPPPTETELNYRRGTYFHAGFEFANLEGNALVGRRWGNSGTGRTERLLTPSRSLMGATMEYGAFGRYFGLAVVGLSYLTNTEPTSQQVNFAPGTALEVDAGLTGPDRIDSVRIHLVHIRAVQPQLRFIFWRFALSVQAGLLFRTGQITGEPNFYRDGFMPLDLLLEAKGGLRMSVVEGMYLYGQGSYAWFLLGEKTDSGVQSAGTWGFNAGVGYAF